MHNASYVLHAQGSGSNSIAIRPAWIVKRCDEILQGIVPGSKTELAFGTGRGKSFGVDRQPATNFLWEYSRKNGQGYGNENRCPLDGSHYADSLLPGPGCTPDDGRSNDHGACKTPDDDAPRSRHHRSCSNNAERCEPEQATSLLAHQKKPAKTKT